MPMLEERRFKTADIYVPAKRRRTLNPKTVEDIAESMIEEGQRTPILVREDGKRFVDRGTLLQDLLIQVALEGRLPGRPRDRMPLIFRAIEEQPLVVHPPLRVRAAK